MTEIRIHSSVSTVLLAFGWPKVSANCPFPHKQRLTGIAEIGLASCTAYVVVIALFAVDTPTLRTPTGPPQLCSRGCLHPIRSAPAQHTTHCTCACVNNDDNLNYLPPLARIKQDVSWLLMPYDCCTPIQRGTSVHHRQCMAVSC